MSVVTVPQQTPLSEGRNFVDEEREVVDRAMDVAEDAEVPVSGTVRVGHDVAQAILNTVEQHDADLVLMGWRGRGRRRDYVLGSNVDRVVQEASCDVLVERIGPGTDGVESILLPTAGGPHAELAAEIARAIARPNEARIDVAHVVGPDDDRDRAEGFLDSTADVIEDVPNVERRLLEDDGDGVVDTIVAETGDYDITIVGATREGLLQQFVFGAIPEEVGRRAECTVIMTKRNLGITSRLTRWLRWE
ncbi:MAG: universal stress protein [Halobacteriaceae archaeon]